MMEASHSASIEPGPVRERVGTTLKRLSRTGALPALPAVASAALGIVRDPDADIDKVCKIIQTDVGLAARVLRIANSAAVGRRTPARKLSEAVVTIGLRKACDVLVAACARQLYQAASSKAELLWNHALAVAIGAEEIARRTRRIDAGRAFLPGLFHDVGRIAFLLADELAVEVLDRMVVAGDGERVFLEREWYGFDHTDAGATLAEEWGLAAEQSDAIRWHHEPEEGGAASDLARILLAADALAYDIGYGGGGVAPDLAPLEELGFAGDSAETLRDSVRQSFEEQRELLS
jgi:HD-like signal output (HDOD) protein